MNILDVYILNLLPCSIERMNVFVSWALKLNSFISEEATQMLILMLDHSQTVTAHLLMAPEFFNVRSEVIIACSTEPEVIQKGQGFNSVGTRPQLLISKMALTNIILW